MSLPRTVAEVIDQHVTLELQSLDRVYLNVYQSKLQTPKAVFYFLREHHGKGAVSSRRMKVISERFVQGIEAYAAKHRVPLLVFEKHQRKENLAAEYRCMAGSSSRKCCARTWTWDVPTTCN